MFEKVRNILVEQLNIEEGEVKPDSRIKEDLGADSLDILQLLMTLEDETGITIPDDKLMTFVTVKDVVEYITENL